MKSLSFLIPAYNDSATIALQVQESQKIGNKLGIPYEIIVVNDGSTDATATILSKLSKKIQHLRVITHRENKGYGYAIKKLYYSAKKEWLFTIPGDYQVEAKEIFKLIPHTRHADMLLGWRIDRHDTGARKHQSHTYNTLIPLLFGTGTHDINSVRLMKTKILKRIDLHGTSAFTDAELVIKSKKKGYVVREIPIHHKYRRKGTGVGGGGKLKVIMPTAWEMVRLFLGRL